MMGCAHSRSDRNYLKQNGDYSNILTRQEQIFKVINVDDYGNEKSSCDIEITKTEIVLYKNDGTYIKWPLRLIRRYGHDENLITFECGRRCKTGQGVYAFKSAQAKEIFLTLQSAIDNCPKENAFLIEQINNQIKETQVRNGQSANFNNSNNIVALSNQTNVLSQENIIKNNVDSPQIINNNTQFMPLNNNNILQLQQPPANHLYANEYMNTAVIPDNLLQNDHQQPLDDTLLIEKELAFGNQNMNFDYVQIDDLKPTMDSSAILNNDLKMKNDTCNNNDNNVREAIKKIDLKSDLCIQQPHLNYTTLDLYENNNADPNHGSDTCIVSTAPATPDYKSAKLHDFKAPNSVPTSPNHDTSTQQYSMIDFDKTKALTGIIRIDNKERND